MNKKSNYRNPNLHTFNRLFIGRWDFFKKSEAEFAVIKAGVDADESVCINKSWRICSKNFQAQNKIEFLYHDPIDQKASVSQIFFGVPRLWINVGRSLLKNW